MVANKEALFKPFLQTGREPEAKAGTTGQWPRKGAFVTMKKTAISSVLVIFASCWVLLSSATADDYEVFRTSSDLYYTGNLGGVSGAHTICGNLASNAGLSGSWKAWICDDSNYPDADFVKAGVGDRYVLVDRTPVAGNGTDQNAWTQLTTQNLLHAINMDQNGTSLGTPTTWTNCHQAGTTDTTDKDCGNWQSTSGQGRIGISTTTFDDWTDWGTASQDCKTAVRLYCFSQTGCAAAEACCIPGVGCDDLTPAACLTAGGTSQGPGTVCATTECAGACCTPSTALCTPDVTPSTCAADGGVFQGIGARCAPDLCPDQYDGCCLTYGSSYCTDDESEASCIAQGGSFQGFQSSCASTTGACCANYGACTPEIFDDCIASGRTAVGGPCGPDTCAPFSATPVPTMNNVGLAVLSAILGGIAYMAIRRRRPSSS